MVTPRECSALLGGDANKFLVVMNLFACTFVAFVVSLFLGFFVGKVRFFIGRPVFYGGAFFLSFGFLLGFLLFFISILMALFKRPRLERAPVFVGR